MKRVILCFAIIVLAMAVKAQSHNWTETDQTIVKTPEQTTSIVDDGVCFTSAEERGRAEARLQLFAPPNVTITFDEYTKGPGAWDFAFCFKATATLPRPMLSISKTFE